MSRPGALTIRGCTWDWCWTAQPFLPEIKTVEINVAAGSLFTLSTAVKLLEVLQRDKDVVETDVWRREVRTSIMMSACRLLYLH